MKVINYSADSNVILEFGQTLKDGTPVVFSKPVQFRNFSAGEMAATCTAALARFVELSTVGSTKVLKARPTFFRVKADGRILGSTDKSTDPSAEILRMKLRPKIENGRLANRELFEETLYKAFMLGMTEVNKTLPSSQFVREDDKGERAIAFKKKVVEAEEVEVVE